MASDEATRRASTDSAATRPASRPPFPARDAQARERRRQLVTIARDLLEREGIGAVTLPRVTELAGCTRTLAYRYFASRDELFAAIVQDYFERLDAALPEAEQRTAIAAFVQSCLGDQPDDARALLALLWDAQMAVGFGGAVLRATPIVSPRLRVLIEDLRARYEGRFTDPLRDAGLSPDAARIAVDAMIASFVGLALRARAGEIERDEAIAIHTRATVGLIRGLAGTR